MKVKVELNSKEFAHLSDGSQPVGVDFEVDLYTESKRKLTPKEETIIFTGVFWTLCTILPHTVIQSVFKEWNEIVKRLQEGAKEGKVLRVKQEEQENID